MNCSRTIHRWILPPAVIDYADLYRRDRAEGRRPDDKRIADETEESEGTLEWVLFIESKGK